MPSDERRATRELLIPMTPKRDAALARKLEEDKRFATYTSQGKKKVPPTVKLSDLQKTIRASRDKVEGLTIVEWLNRMDRAPGEPIEQLIWRSKANDVKGIKKELARIDKTWCFALKPAFKEGRLKWDVAGKLPPEASPALVNLIGLSERGELHRVRECQFCGKWFYADRSHEKFCSIGHQAEAQRSDPKYKAKRAAEARRRRARLKNKGGK